MLFLLCACSSSTYDQQNRYKKQQAKTYESLMNMGNMRIFREYVVFLLNAFICRETFIMRVLKYLKVKLNGIDWHMA